MAEFVKNKVDQVDQVLHLTHHKIIFKGFGTFRFNYKLLMAVSMTMRFCVINHHFYSFQIMSLFTPFLFVLIQMHVNN